MPSSPPSPILLSVFPAAPGGGNPCPVVLKAGGMEAQDMQDLAAACGHESGFVLPPEDPGTADVRFRFFVPEHEMEMCGHAALGAAWLMRTRGRVPGPVLRIQTLSGYVRAYFAADGAVEITQPPGHVSTVTDTGLVLAALGLKGADLLPRAGVLNAATSRIKTLVPVADLACLHGLTPNPMQVRAACEAIGSTGLYPWCPGTGGTVHARQFPCNSGYPEDAATGIAASALFYGLGAPKDGLVVRQGEAMRRPSEIHVRLDPALPGCLLGGRVELVV